MTPEVHYARCGDLHIAYMVFGEGAIDLVWVPGFISHLEHWWDEPSQVRTPKEIQMAFCRMIHFFVSPQEVEEWAAGRDDIETLSLEEAYDLGYQLWPEAYSYAKGLSEAA